MSLASDAPDNGVLSVDAAAALLSSGPEPEAEVEAPAAEAEPEEEQDEVPAEEAGEVDPEADPEASPPEEGEDETPEEEPDEPAIDPPVSWDADEKARFAQLPRETQEFLAKREHQREAAVSTANERAARAEAFTQQRMEAGIAQFVEQYKPALDQLLTTAQQTFQGEWGHWTQADWQALANDDPVQFLLAKDRFAAQQQQLQQLQAAQQAANAAKEQAAHQQFIAAESQRLPTVDPELADPAKGPERFKSLTGYLNQHGVSDLRWASAAHWALANKAMKYDELQASARAQVAAPPRAPKQPSAPPAPRPLRPAAAPVQTDPRTRARTDAEARLSRSGSVDDAVALLEARQKARR